MFIIHRIQQFLISYVFYIWERPLSLGCRRVYLVAVYLLLIQFLEKYFHINLPVILIRCSNCFVSHVKFLRKVTQYYEFAVGGCNQEG